MSTTNGAATTNHAFHLRKGNENPEMVEIDLPTQITYKKVAIKRPKPADAGGNRKEGTK